MSDEVVTMVEPGHFGKAAEWVLGQIEKRERERFPRLSATFGPDDHSKPPSANFPPKQFTRLEIGYSAFAEARHAHASLGLWAEDWCDGRGPRVRIGGLVAHPTAEIHLWAIRLT
jgi:hypothetical protein